MPKIIRVEGTGKEQQSNANIPLSVAGSAGAGQIAMGQAQVQFGREYPGAVQRVGAARTTAQGISILGDAMVRAGERAANAVQVHRKVGDAAEVFQQEKQARQLQNQQGSPLGEALYKTYVDDISKIGKDIREKAARGLTDPKVRKDFLALFDEYTVGQMFVAQKEQLKQQTDYGLKNLGKALDGIIKQGANDDFSQAGFYEQSGLTLLDEAELGGLITSEDRKAKEAAFVETLRTGIIQGTIKKDTNAASILLNTTSEELKISKQRHAELIQLLKATQEGDEYLLNKAQKQDLIESLVDEIGLFQQQKLRIDAGLATPADIVIMKDHLDPQKYQQLEARYYKKLDEEQSKLLDLQEIAMDAAKGNSLLDYAPERVDQLYKTHVDAFETQNGRQATLSEKAMIASGIDAPVRTLAREVNQKIKYGKPEQAADLLSTYTYISDEQSPTFGDYLDRDTEEFMAQVESYVQGGLSPAEAWQTTRDLSQIDSDRLKFNREEYKYAEPFYIENIENTMYEDFSLDAPGGFLDFSESDAITEEAKLEYRTLTQEHFNKYGSIEGARNHAKKVMSRSWGVTKVNGEPTFTRYPIEKLYPKVAPEDIRNTYINDVKPLLPSTVNLDSVQIEAEYDFDPQNPGWNVYYQTETGVRLPVMDGNTLEPAIWQPPSRKKAVEVEEAAPAEINTMTNIDLPIQPGRQRLNPDAPALQE